MFLFANNFNQCLQRMVGGDTNHGTHHEIAISISHKKGLKLQSSDLFIILINYLSSYV
jgi:hypothetical protein